MNDLRTRFPVLELLCRTAAIRRARPSRWRISGGGWAYGSRRSAPSRYWLSDSFNEFLSMLVDDIAPMKSSARRCRWPRLVELWLAHAANPNARDHLGRSLLHHAAVHSIDSVKSLLAAGADATARDHDGNSIVGNGSYRADQLLRAHGATE